MTVPQCTVPLSPAQVAYFWSQVDTSGDCWEWQSYLRPNGYGCYNPGPGPILSHRLAYMLTHGPIPSGLLVCHSCDNRRCCRPDHLFLGTSADNNRDAMSKGRTARGDRNGARLHPERNPMVLYPEKAALLRGERNGNSKLTQVQVDEIRRRFDCAPNISALAREFGVARKTIRSVLRGETWR